MSESYAINISSDRLIKLFAEHNHDGRTNYSFPIEQQKRATVDR
ncbi:hypothetical protein [Nostoc sp. DSM 114167]